MPSIVTPSSDIGIYKDAICLVWSITDAIQPSRDLWDELEIDLINVAELKTIKMNV